ncbi:heparan-alpha-glucosaminide N-acetyltransferase [Fulvimarina sp. 2208YS6-2-32]|uniref:Heparan-alpha-glucosaminide N-acetyltransferase n=1 Tax=Fulvimarina uroteuthidis TaxID=3098149 RepID=A0ABU5I449_9HYPH|nr:heparan-alpha-glucosaminide N-acetyltransferase [Fulvimarina sp. 2208YS6-2-32]MDY8109584.1 heparan-alpha-glucosaminide N-acetyltransferase [Fulvimarina sp. 2208YS6-2-32]
MAEIARNARSGGPEGRPGSPAERGRIDTIDVLRAIALLAMAIYHFTWDLGNFGYVPRDMATSGGWIVFARCIASSFLFLVGFSLILAHARGIRWRPFLVRLAQIVAGAAAITLVTLFVTPDSFVFFGILHQIAFASLAGLLFVRVPWFVSLPLGVAVIALPFVYSSAIFDPRAFVWIGLHATAPFSNDFVPVFPFFGVVLLGIATGRLTVDHDLLRFVRRIDPKLGPLRRLAPLGRHSLAFYLLHQPLLFGLVFLAAQVAPPDPALSFARDCRQTCLATQDEAFCARYCACTKTSLDESDLFTALMQGQIDETQRQSVRQITERCSFEAFMDSDRPQSP